MSSLWNRIREIFWIANQEQTVGKPAEPQTSSRSADWLGSSLIPESQRCEPIKQPLVSRVAQAMNIQSRELPKSYNAGLVGPDAIQAKVFEPAFAHFMTGIRPGNPAFRDPEIGKRWYQARNQVMLHLLQLIGNSVYADHLVLRGSVLLRAWFGDRARVPGDMDWVVIPATIQVTDSWSNELFRGLVDLVRRAPQVGEITLRPQDVVTDDIWTYDRAPGRRIVFPWDARELPSGSVQMDMVFGEVLRSVPIRTPFQTPDGNQTFIRSASPEMSLAWKLQWLLGDVHPQGKDLYDATLLAENTQLPLEMLQRAYQEAGETAPENLDDGLGFDRYADWDNFKREYPWIEGEAADWWNRLGQALTKNTTGTTK